MRWTRWNFAFIVSQLSEAARDVVEWNKKIGMINCFAALRAEIALQTQFFERRRHRRCMCVVLQITLAASYMALCAGAGGIIAKNLKAIGRNISINVYQNKNL